MSLQCFRARHTRRRRSGDGSQTCSHYLSNWLELTSCLMSIFASRLTIRDVSGCSGPTGFGSTSTLASRLLLRTGCEHILPTLFVGFEHFGLSTIGSRLQWVPKVLQRSIPPLPGANGELPGVIMEAVEATVVVEVALEDVLLRLLSVSGYF